MKVNKFESDRINGFDTLEAHWFLGQRVGEIHLLSKIFWFGFYLVPQAQITQPRTPCFLTYSYEIE